MRNAFCFVLLFACVVIAQLALVPAFLPPVLRPDMGLLVGITVLAFAPRNVALVFLFCLGVQADLFGSARFGLLTLSYLLAAGLILWAAWRELTRGDLLAPWVGAAAGTLLAHGLYLGLGALTGMEIQWGSALATLVSLLISACVWGLPCAYACGRFMFACGTLAPNVQEKWASEARLAAARRGKGLR